MSWREGRENHLERNADKKKLFIYPGTNGLAPGLGL